MPPSLLAYIFLLGHDMENLHNLILTCCDRYHTQPGKRDQSVVKPAFDRFADIFGQSEDDISDW